MTRTKGSLNKKKDKYNRPKVNPFEDGTQKRIYRWTFRWTLLQMIENDAIAQNSFMLVGVHLFQLVLNILCVDYIFQLESGERTNLHFQGIK